jgi:hypothetical protein
MSRTAIIVAILTLILGLVAGFFIGRWTLEQKWRDAITIVSADDTAKSASNDADPTPKAGTKILKPMPLGRLRVALSDFSKDDRVKVRVGAFGRDATKIELHLVLENQTSCELTSVEGVAYGFDAWGHPTAVNKGGEDYLTFSEDKMKVAPGAKVTVAQTARYADLANVAAAHVDAFTCSDGTKWKR